MRSLNNITGELTSKGYEEYLLSGNNEMSFHDKQGQYKNLDQENTI